MMYTMLGSGFFVSVASEAPGDAAAAQARAKPAMQGREKRILMAVGKKMRK
jgi:hypothetical protein